MMGGGWQVVVGGRWEEPSEYDTSYWPSHLVMVLCGVRSIAKTTLGHSK